jgi:hypothetical protein
MKLSSKLKHKKIHDSPQIHDNFYFDPKVYFVQFSIPELDINKRKLLENDDEEKIISCRDTRKKMVKLGANEFYLTKGVR